MSLFEDRTEAFIARIWFERREIEDAPPLWRGVVEHVGSNQRRYFTDLPSMTDFVAQHVWRSGMPPTDDVPLDDVMRKMAGNLHQLRKQIFDGLELTAEIVDCEGENLNAGNTFKVKFTFTQTEKA